MFKNQASNLCINRGGLLCTIVISLFTPLLCKRAISLVINGVVGTLTVLLFVAYAKADYASSIINPNDGYFISLVGNSAIAPVPTIGSDGKEYYQIGTPFVLAEGSPSMTVSGTVLCLGRTWGTGINIPTGTLRIFHRLFIYAPTTGISIGAKKVYRINHNLVMTVESKTSIDRWESGGGGACQLSSTGVKPAETQPVSYFTVQLPITITFYIQERIIDSQLVIPAMNLAGYVRVHGGIIIPPYNSWPVSEVTAPIRLIPSQVNISPSSCKTVTNTGLSGTLNIRHGLLNSLNYDSEMIEKITYICTFTASTKVRLRLNYATDEDPQKRLPMINSLDSSKKIYSQLVMTDESTGQSGTDLKIEIKNLKTIVISSHIQGSNVSAGNYYGSAWLIATYD